MVRKNALHAGSTVREFRLERGAVVSEVDRLGGRNVLGVRLSYAPLTKKTQSQD